MHGITDEYSSIGTSSHYNGMEGEVVGSRSTGCVCKLLIKEILVHGMYTKERPKRKKQTEKS